MPSSKKWSAIASINEVSPDWPIKPLKSFSISEKNGFVNGPFGSDLLSSELQDEGVPVVYIRDIKNGCYKRKSTVCVSQEKALSLPSCQVSIGDVIISKVGDPPCEAAIYTDDEVGIVTQDVIRIKTSCFEHSTFLAYLLNSDIGKRQVKEIKITGTRERVSLTDFKKIKLPSPSNAEKNIIVKILSVWDKAINTTESLINNSKKLKKSLMQQLLSGDKRLLDISGIKFKSKWKEVSLNDIAKYQKGYTYKSSEYSEVETENGFLTLKSILRGGGYSRSGIKYLSAPVDDKFSVKAGDVVFSVTDLTRNAEVVGAPIFIPELPFKNTYISMDLVKLEFDSSVNKQFIYYLMKLPCHRNFMRARASGSTVLHLDIRGSKKLRLLIPSSIEEQQKIALILTNVDKDIELLEKQLAGIKQEKKALMQQLLTGKRRVKVDEGEAV